MIFRVKLRWWSSLLGAATMFIIAWLLGGTRHVRGEWGEIPFAVLLGLGAAAGVLLINYTIDSLFRRVLGAPYVRLFNEFARDVVGRMGPVEAVAGGLMAAVGEEPLFRGVVVPHFGSPALGVVVAAILFGLAHLIRRRYFLFFVWGIGEGILFGCLFVVSGSILVPAIAHGVFDTVGFLYFQRLRDSASTSLAPEVA